MITPKAIGSLDAGIEAADAAAQAVVGRLGVTGDVPPVAG